MMTMITMMMMTNIKLNSMLPSIQYQQCHHHHHDHHHPHSHHHPCVPEHRSSYH